MQELKGEPGLMRGRKDFFVISGPSGSGQSKVIDGLKIFFPVNEVISTTTRSMRVKESEGHPYHFISRQEFEEGIENHRFFEWELIHNNWYGVTFEEMKRVLDDGEKIILCNFEHEGVKKVKHFFDQVVTILLHSPTDILALRIRNRQPDISQQEFDKRMSSALTWQENPELYDYKVENKQGELAKTIARVAKIVKKHIA